MKIEGENAQVVINKCNSFYSKCQERSDFMKKILILALSLILLLGVLPSCDSNPPEQSSSSEESSESSSSALPNAPSNTPPKHENDLGYPMVVIDGVAKRNVKNINVTMGLYLFFFFSISIPLLSLVFCQIQFYPS